MIHSNFYNPQFLTLSNGLTLIIEEDHSLPFATVHAWCATGSLHERARLGSGLSHFLEHMLFKGTKHRASGVIAQEVSHYGGAINACTQDDRTFYHITLPSVKVAAAIDILADMMMNAVFPMEEFNKEKEVIRREIAIKEDSPSMISWELLHHSLFHISPLKESVVGHLDLFNKLTRDDLVGYYQERYVPNNLCFIVVGDVSAEKIRSQLELLFKKHPRQFLEPIFVPQEPLQFGKLIRRKGAPIQLSHLKMAWRGPAVTSSDAPAMEVLAGILGLGESSILKQKVCEEKKLVYSISSQLRRLYQNEGFFLVKALADFTQRAEAENEILQQVNFLKSHEIKLEDVERSKNMILSTYYRMLSTVAGRAFHYGEGWLQAGDPFFQARYFRAVGHLTSGDIKRVAQRYLKEDQLTITSLDPESEPTPKLKKQRPNALKNKTLSQKLLLPNGLRLLVKEDHRLPLISIQALFRGGPLLENEKQSGLTRLLTSTMVKGTRCKSAKEIVQELEQVGGFMGNFSCSCNHSSKNEDCFGISINVIKPHLQIGLDLLREMITEATFPEIEVEREKEKQLAEIKKEKEKIVTNAEQQLQKELFGAHAYACSPLGTEKSIRNLTSTILRQAYQQLVVGHNGVIAVVGDVKRAEVKAIVHNAFTTMPAGSLALSVITAPKSLKTPIKINMVAQQKQAIIMKGFLGASVTTTDSRALDLLAVICSGMGSRFFNVMRDELALAYSFNCWNKPRIVSGSFIFSLSVDPQKSEFASQKLDSLIQELIKNGVIQKELDQAKKILIQEELICHQSNHDIAERMAQDELMGNRFDHCQSRLAEVEGITLQQINKVIQKYLTLSECVEIILGPSLEN